jgi:malate dehydrogenase (oxaloacetate-decarboxylating)
MTIGSGSNSIIVRLQSPKLGKTLSNVFSIISDLGGQVGAIDIVKVEGDAIIRDVTIDTMDEEHAEAIVKALEAFKEIVVKHVSDRTFLLHLGGKIKVESKIPIKHRDDLSMAYTPGVARVCNAIAKDPQSANNLTIKGNTVAIVTDGSAVLGLGNLGPLAALPVMEGKAMLMKEFAGVDAFPICLNTQDIEEIIQTVKAIAPSFGAVNLEDIAAPNCFEIETRLKQELDIPVFHDDQHGTAIVLAAAFINALKIVNKKAEDLKIIVNGVGAAGTACTKMLVGLGVKNIIGCDREGAIYQGRGDLNSAKQEYASYTNPQREQGSLYDVLKGADVFVGVSAPNILKVADLKKMNAKPIVFAMSNPTPEIMPEEALPHVAIMATGRSDYPNQINNLLAFPGVFRGALDCLATDINQAMNIAAAYAIANIVEPDALSPDYIVPSVFNQQVATEVAKAVMAAARETGVARM